MTDRIVYVLPIQKEEPKKEESNFLPWAIITLLVAAFVFALTYEKMSEAPKYPNQPSTNPSVAGPGVVPSVAGPGEPPDRSSEVIPE